MKRRKSRSRHYEAAIAPAPRARGGNVGPGWWTRLLAALKPRAPQAKDKLKR